MLKHSLLMFICAITFTKNHSEATIGVDEKLKLIPLDKYIGMSTPEYLEVGQFVWPDWNPLRFLFARGPQPQEESVCSKYEISELIEACKQMEPNGVLNVDTTDKTGKCKMLKMYVRKQESNAYRPQDIINISVYPCFYTMPIKKGKLESKVNYVGLGYRRLRKDEKVLLKYGYSDIFGLVVVDKYDVLKISGLPIAPTVLNAPADTNVVK